MADLPPYTTPRWVKILGIIALVLVLLLGALHLSGVGANHGPARHMPSGSRGTPSSGMAMVHAPFSGSRRSHTPSLNDGVYRV